MDRLAFGLNPIRTFAQVNHVSIGFEEMRPPALRLRLHEIHQIGAKNPIRKTWKIFNMGGGHQLATRDASALKSRDEQRIEVGSGCINGCRIPSRAGSDDD